MTIEEQVDLNHGTIQRITSDHLRLGKITASYIPKQLTDFQRAERIRMYQEKLAKFGSGAWWLCDT